MDLFKHKNLSQRISGNNFFAAITPRFGVKGTTGWSKLYDVSTKIFSKERASKVCHFFFFKTPGSILNGE